METFSNDELIKTLFGRSPVQMQIFEVLKSDKPISDKHIEILNLYSRTDYGSISDGVLATIMSDPSHSDVFLRTIAEKFEEDHGSDGIGADFCQGVVLGLFEGSGWLDTRDVATKFDENFCYYLPRILFSIPRYVDLPEAVEKRLSPLIRNYPTGGGPFLKPQMRIIRAHTMMEELDKRAHQIPDGSAMSPLTSMVLDRLCHGLFGQVSVLDRVAILADAKGPVRRAVEAKCVV